MKNHWLNKSHDKLINMEIENNPDILKTKKTKYGEICNNCGEEMWPMNDENTMMQGDPMCACYRVGNDLSMFYSQQFISNEVAVLANVCRDFKPTLVTVFDVLRKPLLGGTLAGTVYVGEEAIQTFTVGENGTFNFRYIGPWTENNLEAKVNGGSLSCIMGKVYLSWTREPKNEKGESLPIKLVVSYEYNIG